MPRIFISYRRADSMAIAGRIYDHMEMFAGEGNVFQDVDDIPSGVVFPTFLQSEIEKCDVVLVIIGPTWLNITDAVGHRRLDNPADFVRIEVESALKQGKHVIPVLVDGAAFPPEINLPETLRDLCYRNAAVVRQNPDFKRDIERLSRSITELLKPVRPSGSLPMSFVKEDVDVYPFLETAAIAVAPNLSTILPRPFAWCDVLAGKVTLETGGYVHKGGETYSVDRFWMAKYPITNAQFEVFVTSTDGYADPQWWAYSDHARAWRKNNTKPRQPSFKGNDLPRTDVTWYEVVAFCRWLTSRVNADRESSSTTLYKITLPTEQQWQRAAQGDDSRVFPWGDDFDKNRCNTDENGIRRTTPVTAYPNSASPYGVLDMAGNVWEWCLTRWGDGLSNMDGNAARLRRGGSWNVLAQYARAASRMADLPHESSPGKGFRVVCIVPANR